MPGHAAPVLSSRRRSAPDEVCGLLGDHDGGRVEVPDCHDRAASAAGANAIREKIA
jgi:hypothetical protein